MPRRASLAERPSRPQAKNSALWGGSQGLLDAMEQQLVKRGVPQGRLRRVAGTLIEIVLVLAIAGLLLVIVFLAVSGAQKSRRDSQRKNCRRCFALFKLR